VFKPTSFGIWWKNEGRPERRPSHLGSRGSVDEATADLGPDFSVPKIGRGMSIVNRLQPS
jgi:hypothetical protein